MFQQHPKKFGAGDGVLHDIPEDAVPLQGFQQVHGIRIIKNVIYVDVCLWSGNAYQVSVVETIGGHDTVSVVLTSVVEVSGTLETCRVIAVLVSIPALSHCSLAHPIHSPF